MTTNLQLAGQDKPALAPESPFSKEWLAQLRRGLGNTSGKPTLMAGFQVTTTQARQIEEAASRLRASFQVGQADIRAKAGLIARLLSAFPAQQAEQTLRADTYFAALEGCPAWAVERAVGRVIRGEAGLDTRFAPSPAQMAVEARRAMQPLRDDLATLERLRTAVGEREAPPEERERVSEGFDRLLESFGRKKSKEADARAFLEEQCRELGIDTAAIDAVPDQPKRDKVGTWSKLSAQPERTQA